MVADLTGIKIATVQNYLERWRHRLRPARDGTDGGQHGEE
jgi:hypothetical protein